MVDVNLKVPALEMLVKYGASGIGALVGPMLATWKAHKNAEARLIETQAEADSLRIISNAQVDARRSLVAPEGAGLGMLEIGLGGIQQRIEFQEKKRQANIVSVIRDAAEELRDKDVPEHEPDPDWTARFFEHAQDVSSEDMRKIWSKILAGEVEFPGRTSLRTLSILKDMTKSQSNAFSEFTRYSIADIVHEDSYTSIDQQLHSYIPLEMAELGLAHVGIGVHKTAIVETDGTVQLEYCQHILIIEGKAEQKIDIRGHALTGPGRELAKLCSPEPHMMYLGRFAKFLVGKDCTLKIAPLKVVGSQGNLGYSTRELRIIEPAT